MQNTAFALTRVIGTPAARRDTDRQSPNVGWSDGLPTLTGKLVTLRELAATDGSVLLPLVTAPEVARFLSPPPQSLERFAGFIETTLVERRAGRYAAFAIVPHGSDAPVGSRPRSASPLPPAPSGASIPTRCWYRPVIRPARVGEHVAPLA